MRLVGDGVKAWMGMQQIAAAAVRIDGFIILMCLKIGLVMDGLLCCGRSSANYKGGKKSC
jgi:hypothetical protein